jgi:hypothetical protein
MRSGRGRSTHERVLRLIPELGSADAALRHATTQGLHGLDSGAVEPGQALLCFPSLPDQE